MRQSKIAAFLFFAVFCLGPAQAALAQARHFQASQDHFESMAAQASALLGQLDTLDQKSICNYYAAVAATYAVRAHALAQLATVADKVRTSEDRNIVRAAMAETRTYVANPIENDLKMMDALETMSRNSRLKELGNQIINELRVFAHNARNAPPQ